MFFNVCHFDEKKFYNIFIFIKIISKLDWYAIPQYVTFVVCAAFKNKKDPLKPDLRSLM